MFDVPSVADGVVDVSVLLVCTSLVLLIPESRSVELILLPLQTVFARHIEGSVHEGEIAHEP